MEHAECEANFATRQPATCFSAFTSTKRQQPIFHAPPLPLVGHKNDKNTTTLLFYATYVYTSTCLLPLLGNVFQFSHSSFFFSLSIPSQYSLNYWSRGFRTQTSTSQKYFLFNKMKNSTKFPKQLYNIFEYQLENNAGKIF